jgi:hypothetical protein
MPDPDRELPRKLREIIDNSTTEAFVLFENVVELADQQARAEPDAFSRDLILQILFCKLVEYFVNDGGWTPGELCQLLIDDNR